MKNIHFLALATTLIIVSCGPSKKEKSEIPTMEVIPVKVESLIQKSSNEVVNASGQFTTDDETYLSFMSSGIVKEIFVNEGDQIHKGQLLATLDITYIKSQVSQAKIALDKAKRDLERVERLQKDGFATLEQLQNAQSGYDIAEQQVKSAEFNLSYSNIKALSNGRILKKMVNQGQLVNSGTPILLTNGAGSKNWRLKVGVSDEQWSVIEVGNRAKIESELLKNKTIQGKVIRKSESIDPVSGTFTVEIEVITPLKSILASGVFAKATIYTSSEAKNWTIPYAALLDGNANEGYVFVTNDKQHVQKVEVKLGELHQNRVDIMSGLSGFKFVIVAGSAYLNENATISVE